MSTPRLILKRPTGWFAAGWEVAQAMAVLSDGAFKLYVHLCLRSDRHTARAEIEATDLARVLRKPPATIETDLGELYCSGVCEQREEGVEICDRFWPYQKQLPVTASHPQAEFVRQAREAFLKPACVHSTFTPADEKLALNLSQRGVTVEQLRRAIWLGCARKYVALLNGQRRLPITSLAYFATLIEEVTQPQIPKGYWEHVRRRMEDLERNWLQTQSSASAMEVTPAEPPSEVI
jgi:hypothetical protein